MPKRKFNTPLGNPPADWSKKQMWKKERRRKRKGKSSIFPRPIILPGSFESGKSS